MWIFDQIIVRTLPFVPRALVRWVAGPYIAGESEGEALSTIAELNRLGARGTLDLLGEEIVDPELSRAIADRYCRLIRAIADRDLDTGVSVKLSAFMVREMPDLALELTRDIVAAAREAGRFVRIDMEDSSTTDATLDVYRKLRAAGFDNVGVVLQACLKRTFDDAVALVGMGVDVRVVKGIYIEPVEISWRDPEKIRESYLRVVDLLLSKGCRVASATHDERLIEGTLAAMEAHGVEKGEIEFQMLLGVTEHLRDRLIADGHTMRVYVPFGELWHAYSVRRLKENPAIAGHVTKQLMRRIFSRKSGR